jgi:putative nucleotidyltransferase with HDIG domain
VISRDEAHALVVERVGQPNLINHSIATELIMRALAERLGESGDDVERWGLAGLLHDLDYAETSGEPELHGTVSARDLAGLVDDEMIHAVLAHADKVERVTPMDNALWCADPTTGFIVAAALVRPEKDLSGVAVKSLKKRWKEASFARGANREQMAGCEQLGLERDEFLELSLVAMQARASEIGF